MKTLLGAVAALTMATSAQALVVSGSNSVDGVFDASSGTRSIVFAETGTINDLNVTVHFAKCGNEELQTEGQACGGFGGDGYSFNNEIRFVLTAPDGTTSVALVDAGTFSSGEGGEWTISFDDEALSALGLQPSSGAFQPVGSLSAFDGLNINGSWSLLIEDTVGADALSFFDYTIEADVVPEPAALGLFGLGVLGIAAGRRRRA